MRRSLGLSVDVLQTFHDFEGLVRGCAQGSALPGWITSCGLPGMRLAPQTLLDRDNHPSRRDLLMSRPLFEDLKELASTQSGQTGCTRGALMALPWARHIEDRACRPWRWSQAVNRPAPGACAEFILFALADGSQAGSTIARHSRRSGFFTFSCLTRRYAGPVDFDITRSERPLQAVAGSGRAEPGKLCPRSWPAPGYDGPWSLAQRQRVCR